MAKFQSRRTVSFCAEVFVGLDDLCKSLGVSVAGFVEDAVRNKLAVHGVQLPTRDEAIARLKARAPRRKHRRRSRTSSRE